MKAAVISDIKRFAVHDGDGIRTTVFFKGCPLKCIWCHNPEGISPTPQLAYYEHKCIGCGECAAICRNNAHRLCDGIHKLNRQACIGCGNCEAVCLGDALKLYGREYTVNELLPVLLADKDFYESSGGGVTLSGGECLMQADFCAELLRKLKEQGINTSVDTCGFVRKSAIDAVAPYTDIFLYDIKAIDEEVHIKCTGYSNKLILENIRYIDSLNKKIEVRIPYVPEYNSDQIEKTALFLKTLNNLTKATVLPYHNYAGSKYRALEMTATLPKKLPDANELKAAEDTLNRILYDL